ncbi:MAG: hypothetical protein ACI3ZY_10075 [Parabacteroides sp.]
MAYAEASTTSETLTGVAFVLNGKAYQVAKTNATGYDGAFTVYWWKNSPKDINGLTNYSTTDGTNSSGYLPKADGFWDGSTHIDGDWTQWSTYTNATAALSDFNGQENTKLIIEAQTTDDIVQDYTLAKAVIEFRGNSSINESHTDWFVPSCGELAFMFLKMTELNELLDKVSGTQFSTNTYWSSSEHSSNYALYVDFSCGYVNVSGYKNSYSRLRLVRAI